MAGFYLIPLTHAGAHGAGAARGRWPASSAACSPCSSSSGRTPSPRATCSTCCTAALAGLGLVLVAYLIRRLSTISEYAILRAQLAEAGADILTGGTRDDLDELLEYALERMGEQLEATGGAVLLLEDGAWRGRAGFGLGVDAGEIARRLRRGAAGGGGAATETRRSRASSRRPTPPPSAPLTAHLRLERVLIVPMRALEREIGVMVFNRPGGERRLRRRPGRRRRGRGPLPRRGRRQRAPHDRARHQAPRPRDGARRQPRLRPEPRHDRGAGGASSRACSSALGMHACDVYEVDEDTGVLRIVVSYDDQHVDADDWSGARVRRWTTSPPVAAAVAEPRPVVVTSLGRPGPQRGRARAPDAARSPHAGHHPAADPRPRARRRPAVRPGVAAALARGDRARAHHLPLRRARRGQGAAVRAPARHGRAQRPAGAPPAAPAVVRRGPEPAPRARRAAGRARRGRGGGARPRARARRRRAQRLRRVPGRAVAGRGRRRAARCSCRPSRPSCCSAAASP